MFVDFWPKSLCFNPNFQPPQIFAEIAKFAVPNLLLFTKRVPKWPKPFQNHLIVLCEIFGRKRNFCVFFLKNASSVLFSLKKKITNFSKSPKNPKSHFLIICEAAPKSLNLCLIYPNFQSPQILAE